MGDTAARRLRKNPTEAEKRLWSRLRGKQLGGFRFRRQSPIGPYVVDFVCPAAKLVVEVDGGQHSETADAERAGWLESNGYRVIRFWNNDVLENMDGVIEEIVKVLRAR
jgi:very-short-patch-repair endonuclease